MRRAALVAVVALAVLAGGPTSAHGRGSLEPVPILIDHVIAPPPAAAPHPGLYVRPRDFAAEVAWLFPVLRALGAKLRALTGR